MKGKMIKKIKLWLIIIGWVLFGIAMLVLKIVIGYKVGGKLKGKKDKVKELKKEIVEKELDKKLLKKNTFQKRREIIKKYEKKKKSIDSASRADVLDWLDDVLQR